MPNHVFSRVVITGPKEEIRRFTVSAKLTQMEGKWDINALYPNTLSEFSSPVRIVSQEEYDAQQDQPLIGRAMTQEMRVQFIAQYGTADWYRWAITHWGTKWGVYDLVEESLTDEEVILRFSTAWTPATGVIVHSSGVKWLRAS
ncbi:hypothetical protein [Cohnella laeviribosi]|uniref:hypothetical protein n=1 Tax=Cohnella laeviribosi TaxID=380174 RepID=UPI00037B7B4E|nr:hypothetical protein [Cohnella laeviribosi]